MSSTTTSPEQMLSCTFPSLTAQTSKDDTSAGTDADLHCVAFQLDLGLEAELFCDNNGVLPASLFQLAWALVLGCYLERNEVAFGFVNLEHGSSPRQLVRLNIDWNLSAAEAVHAIQTSDDQTFWKGEDALAMSETDANTLLRVSRDSEGKAAHPLALDISIMDKDAQVSMFLSFPLFNY
jgi:hypothetical protein